MRLAQVQSLFYNFFRGFFIITISTIVSLGAVGMYTYLHAAPKAQLASPASENTHTTEVLGVTSLPTPTPVEVLSDTPLPSVMPSYAPHGSVLAKKNYIIALYGDSMEDTMGDRVDILSSLLNQYYPSTQFSLYNYGIGAQNVEQGLSRFYANFTYRRRNYPPISEIHPDIIIIGSFAYNPFSPHDPVTHKNLLTQLVQKAKSTSARVFLLAEIAPLGSDFGQAPQGMTDWTASYRLSHAQEIVDQMQNVYSVGMKTATPVIDVYTKTKSNGPFGSWQYTSKNDGIHPSDNAQYFTAYTIIHSIF